MALDDAVLQWLYLQDSRALHQPPSQDDPSGGHSLLPVAVHHYQHSLLATLGVILVFSIVITTLQCFRRRKQNNEGSLRGQPGRTNCGHRLILALAWLRGLPFGHRQGAMESTHPRFRFWKSDKTSSPRQMSTRTPILAKSKGSPQQTKTERTGQTYTSPNESMRASKIGQRLGNDSTNKPMKESVTDNQANTTPNQISFTTSKTVQSNLKPKRTSKRAQSLEQAAEPTDKNGRLIPRDAQGTVSRTGEADSISEVGEARGVCEASYGLGSQCRQLKIDDQEDAMSELPALAIDKFGEINCLKATESQDNACSSQNLTGSAVEGYNSTTQNCHCQNKLTHNETRDKVHASGSQNEHASQINTEDTMTTGKNITLRDAQRKSVKRQHGQVRHERAPWSRYSQRDQNLHSVSMNTDSGMSVNGAAEELMAGNFSSMRRKYSNIQQDGACNGSRICVSGGCRWRDVHGSRTELENRKITSKLTSGRCRQGEGHEACTELHETSDTASLWTSRRRRVEKGHEARTEGHETNNMTSHWTSGRYKRREGGEACTELHKTGDMAPRWTSGRCRGKDEQETCTEVHETNNTTSQCTSGRYKGREGREACTELHKTGDMAPHWTSGRCRGKDEQETCTEIHETNNKTSQCTSGRYKGRKGREACTELHKTGDMALHWTSDGFRGKDEQETCTEIHETNNTTSQWTSGRYKEGGELEACTELHETNSTASQLSSGRCTRRDGCLACTELCEVNSTLSDWTSNEAETPQHTVRTQCARLYSNSPFIDSLSAGDDHSWSFTRRNPVFEDRYTTFMKVSSLSKRKGRRLRRTIQVEPRPSRKLIVPKTKSENQSFHSDQWSELLDNKYKAPKLACLLLDKHDYLLENGQQFGAQKVYTKDGFKYIVPLTFVSYDNRKQTLSPLSGERRDEAAFSITNLSASNDANCFLDDVSLGISQTTSKGDTSNDKCPGRISIKPQKVVSTNTVHSSSHLSPVRGKTKKRNKIPVNYNSIRTSQGAQKEASCSNTCNQTMAGKTGKGHLKCVTSALLLFNSTLLANETKNKQTESCSSSSDCTSCLNKENVRNKVFPQNIYESTHHQGDKRNMAESFSTSVTDVEPMQNVSRWLSDICRCRVHNSNSTSIIDLDLRRREILARKSHIEIDSSSPEDFTSSCQGLCDQGLPNHKKNSQPSDRPSKTKCTAFCVHCSHAEMARLAEGSQNQNVDKTTDVYSYSDSSSCSINAPVKHTISKFTKRQKCHTCVNSESHCAEQGNASTHSEYVKDLEKDKHKDYRKLSVSNGTNTNDCQYPQNGNFDDIHIKKKQAKILQKIIRKLTAKKAQNRLPGKRFRQSTRSHTGSMGDTSVRRSVPLSYKSSGKLTSGSSVFTQMPLFNNRQSETVNIVVRLESSAQKNLIEKHTLGTLMSSVVPRADSCLPGEVSESFWLEKNLVASEAQAADFGRLKRSPEATLKRRLAVGDAGEVDAQGQFRLHCAVLSTDCRGFMSVKKFEGEIQGEDTIFMNDASGSQEQTNALDDLTYADLSSELSFLGKRGGTQVTISGSGTKAYGNEDGKEETNTELVTAHKTGLKSEETNFKRLSLGTRGQSPGSRAAMQTERALHSKVMSKKLHKPRPQQPRGRRGAKPRSGGKDGASCGGIQEKLRATDRLSHTRDSKQGQKENRETITQNTVIIPGKDDMKKAPSKSLDSIDHGKHIPKDNGLGKTRGGDISSYRQKYAGDISEVTFNDLDQEHMEECSKDLSQCIGKRKTQVKSLFTDNKATGRNKQTFSNRSRHSQQATDTGDLGNRNGDLLSTTTTRNAVNTATELVNKAPCQVCAVCHDMETQPNQEAVHNIFGMNRRFNKQTYLSGKFMQAAEFSEGKELPQIKQESKPANNLQARTAKDKTDAYHLIFSESVSVKEVDKCDPCVGDLPGSRVIITSTSKHLLKEICPETQNDTLKATYSRENISKMSKPCNSSEFSLNSIKFPRERKINKQLRNEEGKLLVNNQMDQKRNLIRRTLSNKTGRYAHNNSQFQTSAKITQRPSERLDSTNRQTTQTPGNLPSLKQPLETTTSTLAILNSDASQSMICQETANPTENSITKRSLSSEKREVNASSQNKLQDRKTLIHNDKSLCKSSTYSDNSLTFNACTIPNNDNVKPAVSGNNLPEGITDNKKSDQVAGNEKEHKPTNKRNNISNVAAGMFQNSQELNASNVKSKTRRLSCSKQADPNVSGTDGGCKSVTSSKSKRPRNIQQGMLKRMFQFCKGEDGNTEATINQSEPVNTAGSSLGSYEKSRSPQAFSSQIGSKTPHNPWTVKLFQETFKPGQLPASKDKSDNPMASPNPHAFVSRKINRGRHDSVSRKSLLKINYPENSSCVQNSQQHQPSDLNGRIDIGPDIQPLSVNILDITEDCYLPDQLPSKIGGSTDASSADISENDAQKKYQNLACDKEHYLASDPKLGGHINVDELREKYLREMNQRGLSRNNTFRINCNKNILPDKCIVRAGNSHRKMGSVATATKSPEFSRSKCLVACNKNLDSHVPERGKSSSRNSLNRKRDDKHEDLNLTATNTGQHDWDNMNERQAKNIPERCFRLGSDWEQLQKAKPPKNKTTFNSKNSMSPKQIKNNWSPPSKSNAAVTKRDSCEIYSPNSQHAQSKKQSERQMEQADSAGCNREWDISKSNSACSTTANIPVMEQSEMLSRAFSSPGNKANTHVLAETRDRQLGKRQISPGYTYPRTKIVGNQISTHTISPDYTHPITNIEGNQLSTHPICLDYIHSRTNIVENQLSTHPAFLDYTHPRINIIRGQVSTHHMPPDYMNPVDKIIGNQLSTQHISPHYTHVYTTAAESVGNQLDKHQKSPDHTHPSTQTASDQLRTQPLSPFHNKLQKYTHESSEAKMRQQSAPRRPSQIPKMKRSETPSKRIQRADTKSVSQTRQMLRDNQDVAKVKRTSSSCSKLETISVKPHRMRETPSGRQISDGTNRTSSEQENKKDVDITRSPGSSTDVVISWFEKENAHDLYQQESDSEIVFSLHKKNPSTGSHSPSNYTLTTVCGFQGQSISMPDNPGKSAIIPEINKRGIGQEVGAPPQCHTNESPETKHQIERLQEESPPGKFSQEHLQRPDSQNKELVAHKEESNKIPFWQKQLKSNIKTSSATGRDSSAFIKIAANLKSTGLKEDSKSEISVCKSEEVVKECNNKNPVENREQTKMANTVLREGEMKQTSHVNITFPSRLHAMRSHIMNRKYVNSALMYNMKKQSARCPYKTVNDNKQQHHVVKNPAISTNNSAVLDRRDVLLRYRIPTKAHLCVCDNRHSKSCEENCQLQIGVQDPTMVSKPHHKINQNAIYFRSTNGPICRQMKGNAIYAPSLENLEDGGTVDLIGPFNREFTSLGVTVQQKELPSFVAFTTPCCENPDTAVRKCPLATNYKQEKPENVDNKMDSLDNQNQGNHQNNHDTNEFACTESDSCKVSFDWYKPTATSTGGAFENDRDSTYGHHSSEMSTQGRIESRHAAVVACDQPFIWRHNPGIDHGPRCVQEMKETPEQSPQNWLALYRQEIMEEPMHNTRYAVMSQHHVENGRLSEEEMSQYRYPVAPDLLGSDRHDAGCALFQQPHVVQFGMIRNTPKYFQPTRVNHEKHTPNMDTSVSQPARRSHISNTVTCVSDNRRHYITRLPHSSTRHYNRSDTPFLRVPTEDASLSNLNSLYELLQQDYNEANAVYHYNWVLAKQNTNLHDCKSAAGQFERCAHSNSSIGHIQDQTLLQRSSEMEDSWKVASDLCQQSKSNNLRPQPLSKNCAYIQPKHVVSNSPVAQYVLHRNRMQLNCPTKNHHFLIPGYNNQDGIHQSKPVKTPRIEPEFPSSTSPQPKCQYSHQPLELPYSPNRVSTHAWSGIRTQDPFLQKQQQPCGQNMDELNLLRPQESKQHMNSSYWTLGRECDG